MWVQNGVHLYLCTEWGAEDSVWIYEGRNKKRQGKITLRGFT